MTTAAEPLAGSRFVASFFSRSMQPWRAGVAGGSRPGFHRSTRRVSGEAGSPSGGVFLLSKSPASPALGLSGRHRAKPSPPLFRPHPRNKQGRQERRLRGSGFSGAVDGHERFENGNNLVLLAARQLGSLLEKLAHLPACGDGLARPGFAKHFLDGYAERLGHGQQELHFAHLPGALPIQDIGMAGADLAGELAPGQSRLFTKAGEVGV